MRIKLLTYLIPVLCLSCGNPGPGQELPRWKEGELDIHAVRTDRGECYFYILPDGTTMAVDCGELRNIPDSAISHDPYSDRDIIRRQLPYPGRKAHEIAADYMRRHLPEVSADSLDYMVLTHHHDDHMSGIPGLYRLLPFRNLVDHADTAAITQEALGSKHTAAYADFLQENGLVPLPFALGPGQNIMPRHGGNWQLTGICSDGNVWTSDGVVNAYEEKKLSENGASIGFLLSYGAFDWVATGDAGDPNARSCFPALQGIGRKVEAMKVPHHFSWKTLSPRVLELLRPQVLVSESFWSHQPWKVELAHLLEVIPSPDLFLTGVYEGVVEDNALGPDDYELITAHGGNVVLRVAPGGKTFKVYLTDPEGKILSSHGPYKSEEN
jgi:hypothetical protein